MNNTSMAASLLSLAHDYRASDIHIAPGSQIRYRIDGLLKSLVDGPVLTDQDTLVIAQELMSAQQYQQFEEHGQLEFVFADDRQCRYRISFFRQRGLVSAAIRPIAVLTATLDKLGLPQALKELALNRQGLLLVSGPTGSGKSTSLAAILDYINTHCRYHILTLEDPIEFVHSNKSSMVSQREIGTDTESFAMGLKSALRQDPDVILVGEMRDLETISIALTAAETGHLVLGTLHTLDSAQTIERIVNVFPGAAQQQIRQQLASVLLGVMAQRLIPLQSGQGRVACVELMINSPAISNLIRSEKVHQIPSIMRMGQTKGMQTMELAVRNLLQQQLITGEAAHEALAGYGDME